MKDCTGPSANWCPNCGNCKCPLNKYNERTLEDFDCPLHSCKSSHAEEEIEYIMNLAVTNTNTQDMWQRLIDRYSFENVFKTGLVRNIQCSHLVELKKLMTKRRELGIERYEVVLLPFNGRPALTNLMEEQLDSLAYSEQVSIEFPELSEEMLKWQKFTVNSIQKLITFKLERGIEE
jgi:hypothetical protein